MAGWVKSKAFPKGRHDNTNIMDPVRAAGAEMKLRESIRNIGAVGEVGAAAQRDLDKATSRYTRKAIKQRQSADRAKNAGGPSLGRAAAKRYGEGKKVIEKGARP